MDARRRNYLSYFQISKSTSPTTKSQFHLLQTQRNQAVAFSAEVSGPSRYCCSVVVGGLSLGGSGSGSPYPARHKPNARIRFRQQERSTLLIGLLGMGLFIDRRGWMDTGCVTNVWTYFLVEHFVCERPTPTTRREMCELPMTWPKLG
jgi:hypothetical protein